MIFLSKRNAYGFGDGHKCTPRSVIARLFASALCVGMLNSNGLSAGLSKEPGEEDVLSVAQRGRDVDSAPLLAAINDLMNLNAWRAGRVWGVSINGNIAVVPISGGIRAKLPGVEIHVANGKIRIVIGDLDVSAMPGLGREVRLSYEMPKRLNILDERNSDLGSVHIDVSQVSLIWERSLSTLLGTSIRLRNIAFNNKGSQIAKIGSFEMEGALKEGIGALWSGTLNHSTREVDVAGAIKVAEVTTRNGVEGVDIPQLIRASRSGNYDFGSWFLGGTLLPDFVYQGWADPSDAIRAVSFLAKLASVTKSSTSQFGAHKLDVKGIGFISEMESTTSAHLNTRGLWEQKSEFSIQGMRLTASSGWADLIPTQMAMRNRVANVPMHLLSDQLSPLFTELKAKLDDADSFLRMWRQMAVDMAAASSIWNIDNFQIEAPSFDASMTGALSPNGNATLGFTASAELKINNARPLFERVAHLSSQPVQSSFSLLLKRVEDAAIKEGGLFLPNDYRFKIAIDPTSRLSINGIDFGPLSTVQSAGDTTSPRKTAPVPSAPSGEIAQRLQLLKRLYDQGLVDESEYQSKRREILNQL